MEEFQLPRFDVCNRQGAVSWLVAIPIHKFDQVDEILFPKQYAIASAIPNFRLTQASHIPVEQVEH